MTQSMGGPTGPWPDNMQYQYTTFLDLIFVEQPIQEGWGLGWAADGPGPEFDNKEFLPKLMSKDYDNPCLCVSTDRGGMTFVGLQNILTIFSALASVSPGIRQ